MASSVQAYNIILTNSIGGSGFVDNVNGFGLSMETTPVGLTNVLSIARRGANMRYRAIINQLQLVTNCYIPGNSYISGYTAFDPNNPTAVAAAALTRATTEATNFAFQMFVEHGAASLVTPDESNPGQVLGLPTVDGDLACIKRCIARALTMKIWSRMDVFDPTSMVSLGTTKSVPRYGTRINNGSIDPATPDVAPYASSIAAAEAVIAVTRL